MAFDSCYESVLRCFFHGSSGATFWHPQRKRMVLPVLALAATLVVALALAVPHAGDPEPAGGAWPALDLAALASLSGYAFAQIQDGTPPAFVASKLDSYAGVLTITFSETIDAASIVPAKMHVRESGNYAGGTTLTADELGTDADSTTISFALTPLHRAAVAGLAAPELTIEPGAVRDASGNLIDGTFDTSTITSVGATTLPPAQEDNLRDIAFSNNGTKMFVISSTTGAVTEYDLSPPFDTSNPEFVAATSLSDQESEPQDLAFSNNGTKMFVIGSHNDTVIEYDLDPPFDASTLSFVAATSISSKVPYPAGIAFSNDGTKMFVIDTAGKDVNEYDLSIPFDASTLEFVNATSIEEQEGKPAGIAFSNDGTKMFVIGTAGKDVNEYDLSIPFDASTLEFVNATSISEQEVNPTGIAFSSDGAKMFVTGLSGKTVNAYALSSVYPITVTDIPVSNTLPVLDDISSETVNEHEPISINVTATDDYGDALEYSLTGNEPDGASITLGGLFTWTPSEEQDGTHIFGVLVSDLSDGTVTQDIMITVNEVNVAPVLDPIDSRNVTVPETLTFTAIASDVDIINGTADALTFSFYPIPVGVSLNSTTGVFSWTPTENQVRDHIFVVSVTDDDAIDTESFTVTVLYSDTIIDNDPISNKKSSSSSSSIAPIVDLSTLAQARIVDIPSDISEQISLHDASDPLEPILHNDTFDCPLTINEYCYLLDDIANTLTPQTVTADQSTEIAFTVYTKKDLTHFTLYLNMQDNDVNYADSDTYITYTGDGTVEVTDPHGYIGSATVTVTQEDDHIPEKKTVSITIYFDEPMGSTNMVAYMWNTDRKAAFIKIIDALEVAAALLEPVMQAADPEPLEPDSELPADPEPVTPDFADDAADLEHASPDTLWPDDYDDAQVLNLIRMWSGFESELITDTQLLELLGLEDYQDVDLPDWMMAELGVLVAKGDVTVDEFMLALQYVLEHA